MSDDVKMMTYADAAHLLGVKLDSVKRRARNRRWKREKGNDGLVRIGVPVELLVQPVTDNPPDDTPADTGDILRLEKLVSALETEVKLLREYQSDLIQDRDEWRSMAQKRRSWWPF